MTNIEKIVLRRLLNDLDQVLQLARVHGDEKCGNPKDGLKQIGDITYTVMKDLKEMKNENSN